MMERQDPTLPGRALTLAVPVPGNSAKAKVIDWTVGYIILWFVAILFVLNYMYPVLSHQVRLR